MREENDVVLDHAHHLWFSQRRSKGNSISGSLLSEKALELKCLVSYTAWMAFGFRLSERYLIPIGSDKRHSTVYLRIHLFTSLVWRIVLSTADYYSDFHRLNVVCDPMFFICRPCATYHLS
ncbi:hypothetical protein TNCV_2915751 [Trichonephila clavipes]|nr:hypothetical protein TNCV_2915751 [Trichonephila clavipes]